MTSDPPQAPSPVADLPEDGKPSARRLSPRSIVTNGVRYLRGLILPVIVVMISRGFSGDRVELAFTFGIPVVAAILSVIGGVFHWAFSRYALTDRELEVKTGIVSRQQRVVPVERIQAVDFEEAPLERILGLVRVRVETAASGHDAARIELNALSRREAEALRTQLLAMRARSSGTNASTGTADESPLPTATPDAGDVLYRLSLRDLLVAGATSGRVGPAAAVIGIAVQFGTDLVPRSWWDRVPWDSATHAGVQAIVAAVIVLGLLAWLMAIGSTVLTFAGFELTLHGEGHQLVIRHGLLDRKRRTIPLARIQGVVTFESLLRQPFGLAEIRIESAGQAGREDNASGVLVPFIRTRDIPALISRAAPDFAMATDVGTLESPPKRAAQRYIVPSTCWTAVFCLVVSLGLWKWLPDLPSYLWSVGTAVLVTLAAGQGWLEYRAAGWGLTSAHLVLRWRSGLGQHTMVTRRQRLQHRGTSANPFQRRVRLATFHAAVASGHSGGHFTLRHLEEGDAAWLLAELEPARTRSALQTSRPEVSYAVRAVMNQSHHGSCQ